MEKQPAIKSYFFEKGYKDLWNTIKESWQSNLDDASDHFDKIEFEFEGAFHFGVGVAIFIFGSLIFGIVSLFHVILLLLVATFIYLSFSLVWGADKIYRSVNKIFTVCPHTGCYHKFDIPVYHCPNCGNEHTRLHPGPYGILNRTCTCGHQLPQTFLNGRKDLYATCPSCKQAIDAEESRPIVVPVIGAPSVGKTCFVTSMVHHLKEEFSPSRDIEFKFTDELSNLTYQQNINSFANGGAPGKTVEAHPTAMNIFLQPNGVKVRRILYLYDPAGEAYLDTSNTQVHRFYDYFHGAFFLIDPFSIPAFYHEYEGHIQLDQVKPSSELLEDVYDRIIINLEKNFGIKSNQRISVPFAILINKVDVADLEEKIGATAGRRLQEANPEAIKTTGDGIHEACRQFFEEYEMGHMLDRFDSKFKNFRFFSISSMATDSIRVDEAVEWLFGKVDKGMVRK